MPAYLMLMDGLVEAWPQNERLLIAAAQGYASYATAFTEDEEGVLTANLYAHAKGYALKALEIRGFERPVERPFDEFEERLKDLGRNDVPYLFWAATCWGNWIQQNMSSMEAMAELPRVELIMKRVMTLDEGFYYGGPHLFMGIWYASRPRVAGGNLDTAKKHFERAIELGHGHFLMASVYYATNYAVMAFDRELFVAILEHVLATPIDIVPELTLLNTVAHHRAEQLLANVDEYF